MMHHSYFYEDMITGTPFYMDNYHDMYNPTTSYVLFLLTFPLLLTNLSFFEITVVGFAILTSIGVILKYLLLQKYFETSNKLTIALVVILDPSDLFILLIYGLISVSVTINVITAVLILQHDLNRINVTKIMILLIISASAHRTGMVVQLIFVLTYIIFNLKKIKFSKEVGVLLTSIFSIFTFLFIDRAYPLGMSYLKQVQNPTFSRTWFFINSFNTNPLLFIFAFILAGFIVYTIYTSKNRIKLFGVDKAYIAACLFLFAIPIYDILISSRFIIVLTPLILILVVFLLQELPKRFEAYFQASLAIMGFLLIQLSIDRSITYVLSWIGRPNLALI